MSWEFHLIVWVILFYRFFDLIGNENSGTLIPETKYIENLQGPTSVWKLLEVYRLKEYRKNTVVSEIQRYFTETRCRANGRI